MRNRNRCAVCGRRGDASDPITRGHIIPRAHGGSDETWNIQPEHLSCNQERGTRWTRGDSAKAVARLAARSVSPTR